MPNRPRLEAALFGTHSRAGTEARRHPHPHGRLLRGGEYALHGIEPAWEPPPLAAHGLRPVKLDGESVMMSGVLGVHIRVLDALWPAEFVNGGR
jgi:hypothetical protein